MRVPLTPYGLREIILGTALCAAAGAVCVWLLPPLVALPALAWVCLLSFFRDPERPGVAGEDELLSPADGTVYDIEEMDAPAYLEGRALRVGIFMSVLNVHVNRAPAVGTVRLVEHVPGKFYDARSERSKTENEHNFIGLELAGGRPVLVNQIAGVVARRVVCKVSVGQDLQRAERVGMVKFGSRVELYVPLADRPAPRVKIGDRVKAGRDVLVAYTDEGEQNQG